MEFELIDDLPLDAGADDDAGAVTVDHERPDSRSVFEWDERYDQAICIPEQEDG